jgi:hypothetical protein
MNGKVFLDLLEQLNSSYPIASIAKPYHARIRVAIFSKASEFFSSPDLKRSCIAN